MKRSVARHHADWRSLLDISGPFLSMEVLRRVFPQGLEQRQDEHEVRQRIGQAFDEWSEHKDQPAIHRAWVRFVLREVLELDDASLAEGQRLPAGLALRVEEHAETLRPDYALLPPDCGLPRLLVQTVPPGQSLDRALAAHRWKAAPSSRMAELLRATGVVLGLVTNGVEWMLVHAPRRETASYVTFSAELWTEEPVTLRAFASLLSARRFFSVAPAETLEALFAESAKHQHEVTDRLGYQVRKAVELLIQAIDRVDRDRDRKLLSGFDERQLYEAAVTVMMRLVFLFAAEERALLPLGVPLYDQHYAASTLSQALRAVADRQGEEVLERRYDAWSRLLSLFRAVHGGVQHDALRLPAYGGSLFDPDRFPFLEGRLHDTAWRDAQADPLPIDNRTVLQLLEALQLLRIGPGEAQRLSFSALDVEQIGHVYEGLLDHTAARATDVVLGLEGSKDLEPELPVAVLDEARAKSDDALVALLEKATGRSTRAIGRALAYEIPKEDRRLLTVCDNQQPTYRRVAPYAGLLRSDPSGYPVVITKGGVYVTQGADRRTTGTHYTPRSLTEPIVQYTLEPLVYDGPAEGRPREEWKLRSARELLTLKVCDLAMGSGAFLVQACRFLSQRLVEAWEEAEAKAAGRLVITPEGDLSSGNPSERPLPRDAEERLTVARRIVADRCLYGVDRNPMAVEMAKLSLWLVTLQRDRPFTFVDHALRCGDSLLGLTRIEQIERFHIAPERAAGKPPLFDPGRVARKALERARQLREKLESFTVESVRDADDKARLLHEAETATVDAHLLADLVVGAALSTATRGERALDEQLDDLGQLVIAAFGEGSKGSERERARTTLTERALGMLDEGRGSAHPERRPLHWVLEFPEVFGRERLIGFDAFLSNPPYMTGLKLETALGTDYRALLVQHIGRAEVGVRGTGDLCAYFFLRVGDLLAPDGDAGLLATNTIAQGDSRRLGLDQLAAAGFSLPRAVASRAWPGDANLEVSLVFLRNGGWSGERFLDDTRVVGITPQLTVPGRIVGAPFRLSGNAGMAFIGSYVLGLGFTMAPEEAAALIEKDSRNRDVLFPYLNGEDLNSRPDQSPSRWVINFHDCPLDRGSAPPGYSGPTAADYPDCLAIVRARAKPERDRLIGRNPMATRRGTNWWRYAGDAKHLYEAVRGLRRVLIRARVSDLNSMAFVPSSWIYSDQTVVFAFDDPGHLALLQSMIHDVWVQLHRSTMRTDVRYTPSACFDTFVFPKSVVALAAVGERYEIHRRGTMAARNEGLTKTYNRFNSPADRADDVATLRALHVEMDHAVALAYGWKDLDLDHNFHETKQGVRFTVSEPARREVLDRLLELNHQRYAEEVAQGLHGDDAPKRAPARKAKGAQRAAPTAPARVDQLGFGFIDPLLARAAPQVATDAKSVRVAASGPAKGRPGRPRKKTRD